MISLRYLPRALMHRQARAIGKLIEVRCRARYRGPSTVEMRASAEAYRAEITARLEIGA